MNVVCHSLEVVTPTEPGNCQVPREREHLCPHRVLDNVRWGGRSPVAGVAPELGHPSREAVQQGRSRHGQPTLPQRDHPGQALCSPEAHPPQLGPGGP